MRAALKSKQHQFDAFVAVGGWAQFNEKSYRKVMRPFTSKLTSKEVFVVMADTQRGQIELVKEGLSHVNVGQNPYEMGRKALVVLHSIVTKQAYKEINFTPLILCNQQNNGECKSN